MTLTVMEQDGTVYVLRGDGDTTAIFSIPAHDEGWISVEKPFNGYAPQTFIAQHFTKRRVVHKGNTYTVTQEPDYVAVFDEAGELVAETDWVGSLSNCDVGDIIEGVY